MRLSSKFAAVSASLILAWSALAQPVVTPAGQPGGSVELSDTPKDDPEARKLLIECVAEINKMGPISFKGKYASAGAAMVIDGNADVRFVRNNAAPQESLFWGKGRLQMPALDKPDFHVSRYTDEKGAKRTAWQDDLAKAVFDRPEGPGPDGKETEGGRQLGLVLRSMLLPALISNTPFADELKESRAGTDVIKVPCVFLADEVIGGEPCKVVSVIFKQGSATRRIWISPKDKLPRKYEQFRNGLSRYWELDGLVVLDSSKASEAARMPTPDGYRLDQSNVGGAQAPVVATPTAPGVQPAVTSGGPQNGQLAPDFDLKTAGGPNLSLAGLKGQTVVATFGGSVFPQSWSNQSAAATALAGKPVKVLALACRESDPSRAAKAFADAHGVGQLLLDADATASLYNVRGFPSTVVIGPDGKVAAFFEGVVTEAELAAAVVAASAPTH